MSFVKETSMELGEEKIAAEIQKNLSPLVIYGTTQSSLAAFKDCLGRERSILGFCDLYIAMQEELPVYPVCKLRELGVERVILPAEHDTEVVRQLLAEQGIEEILTFSLEVALEPYVIYGVGDWGNYAFNDLGTEIDIRFFVDRDKSRQGRDFHGKEVRDPEVLREHSNIPVIIAVERDSGIREYLQRLGVKKIFYFRRGMSRDEFFRQVKGTKGARQENPEADYYYEKGTPKMHRPSLAKVLEKLLPYEVISFDIFDTLLFRKVGYPNDVFEKMALEMAHSDFCRVRKQAEDMARDAKEKETGSREVDLHEIYEVLAKYYGIDSTWEDREIELELSLCVANPFMKELYQQLQQKRKTIVLMSDMYLPAEVIARMMEKCGYSGWEKFYLSNEYLLRKGEGTLQQKLREDYPGKAIAHVGDSLQGDVKKTLEAGVAALHWPDCRLDYRPNNMESLGGSLYLSTINNHLGTGLWSQDIYYTHGYRVGGILTAGFCQYVDRVAKEKHVDKILFCARDCDIVSKAYEKYWGTVPSEYIEISRYAIFQAAAERFLYDFLNRTVLRYAETFRSSLTIREIFQESGFGYLLPALEESDIEQFMFPSALFDRRKQLRDFLFGQKEAILAHNAPHAEAAKAYFREVIGEAQNILVVDIGWTGTCITALKYFLETRFPEKNLRIYGALLATSRERNLMNGFEDGTMGSFAYSPLANLDQARFMMPAGKTTREQDLLHMPLEFLFTSESASLLSYEQGERGEISFRRTAHSPGSCQEISSMQQGMLDFIGDYLAYARDLCGEGNIPLINPYVAFNPLADAIRNRDYIYEVYKNFNYDAFSLPLREDQRPFGDLFDMSRNLTVPGEEGKARILFVTPELPYTGAPRSLLRMCKVARDLGYQPIVWSAKAGPFGREYEKEGIRLQVVPERELGSAAVKEQLGTFAMAVCNTIVTDGYVRALQGKVPLVWYIREATNIPDFCRQNPRRLETLKQSPDLCCVSQYAARAIEKYAQHPVRVIHNCVEDEVSMAADYVPGTGENVRFVQFGTMEYRKGYDVLVSAYLSMPEEYRERAELYFAGGFINSGTAFCSYLFRRMKDVPGIHYLGVVRGEEKKIDTLSRMDVVVVASRDESCSLVALEGAMLGRPLIVTENVGAKYMVTEENGRVVETGDADALRRAMMEMIDRKEKLAAMGRVSRRIYEEKAVMDSYREELKNLFSLYTGTAVNPKVIVSLTSYPDRLPTLHKCVKSLLTQSIRPEKVLLYLSQEQFPEREENLTAELQALQEDEIFEIRFVEGDMGPHKKYWYAMQEYPEHPVIVVDDDAVYDYAMVERLLAAYRKYPHCIPCMRTNMIFLNEEGNFRTYRSWRLDDQTLLDIPSYQLLPVGVGGVLYPPHALPEAAFDKESIEKTCPHADDLWLKFWTTHEGYKAVRPRNFCRYNDIPGTQTTALHKSNVRRNENDEAIENIRAYFDEKQDGFAGILERIEKDRFC